MPIGETPLDRVVAAGRRRRTGPATKAAAPAKKRTVEISEAAYVVVCGLAQSNHEINHGGIKADCKVWDEIRRKFPKRGFGEREGITYDPEAGT